MWGLLGDGERRGLSWQREERQEGQGLVRVGGNGDAEKKTGGVPRKVELPGKSGERRGCVAWKERRKEGLCCLRFTV